MAAAAGRLLEEFEVEGIAVVVGNEMMRYFLGQVVELPAFAPFSILPSLQ